MKNKIQIISRRTIVLLSFFCILVFVSLNIKAKNAKEKFIGKKDIIDIIYEQSIQDNFDFYKIVDKENRYINWDIFYDKFKKKTLRTTAMHINITDCGMSGKRHDRL